MTGESTGPNLLPESAESLHAPFTAAEVAEAIKRTRGRACVVGPLKPVLLKYVALYYGPCVC